MIPSIGDMPTRGGEKDLIHVRIAILFLYSLELIQKVQKSIFNNVSCISLHFLTGLPTYTGSQHVVQLGSIVCSHHWNQSIWLSHLKITLYTLYSVLMLQFAYS